MAEPLFLFTKGMSQSPEASEELREELLRRKQEVSTLRLQVQELARRKEQAFQETRSRREGIRSLLGAVKKLKQERDQLTAQVQQRKQQREQFNLASREKFEEKQKVAQKQQQLQQQAEFRGDPRRVQEQIRFLEQKLETEVVPFEQEKRIRRQIKGLKVQHQQLEQLNRVWKEAHLAAAGFSQVRLQAQEAHQQVQDLAQQAQRKHEEIQKLLQQVRSLREQEKPSGEKYAHFKEEYLAVRKTLQETERRLAELQKIFQEEDEKSFHQKVREKTAEVKEKLRQKKKLSTEDILALQAVEE